MINAIIVAFVKFTNFVEVSYGFAIAFKMFEVVSSLNVNIASWYRHCWSDFKQLAASLIKLFNSYDGLLTTLYWCSKRSVKDC